VTVVGARVELSAYTTLGLGGPAGRFVEAGSDEELVAAVRAADRAGEPVLVLGGGSNLVIADDGFPGTVIHVASRGVTVGGPSGDETVIVTASAGENWDGLVEWTVSEKISGIECMAGVPGLTGSTPIQNVGAYGQDVSQTITAVRAFDRQRGEVVSLTGPECGFGYRTSMLKRAAAGLPTGRFVVLEVTFELGQSPLSAPVRYAELARTLGIGLGEQVPLEEARAAVLALRRGKGMVLEPGDPDTRSVGSFFTNPILTAEQFAEVQRRAAQRSGAQVQVPHFPADDGGSEVKVPAAWLIEQAGFSKGYGSAARISTKHTLALTNPGKADTAALLALAREIRAGVAEAFGVELANEPVLVGVTL
jgi:UDP-N-acetylmuramate dehydrogenase